MNGSPPINKSTHATAYKVKLWLFAILGYVVIFGALLLLVVITGGLAWLATYSAGFLILLLKNKLIFVLLPLMWVLARALWVKMEPPQGYELAREHYPVLFEQIDSLSSQLKAPKIDHVILTSEVNAAVTRIPRLGIFGWNKSYLILGLELLLLLSPNQARAVIAHELGHLSGNHSRFNSWIYRVRQTWYQVMLAFHEQNNMGANIMKGFFNWYYPRFDNYSFGLARQNEYEADNIAVHLTSQEDVANALVKVNVSAPYVDSHYWKNFFKLADFSIEPKQLPWSSLSHFLSHNKQAEADLDEALRQSMAQETSHEDTHPSLKDRLLSIGINHPVLPPASSTNAAQVWFGDRFQATLDDFDRHWLVENKAPWKERYEYAVKSKTQLKKLEAADQNTLSDDDLWQQAALTEEFVSAESAEPLFRTYYQRHPDNPEAAFVMGRLAFDKDGDELLSFMKVALKRDHLIIDACQYAYAYLMARQREQEANWWRDCANTELEKQTEDQMDRARLQNNDQLIAHQLNETLVNYLKERFQELPKVKKVWLAEKKTKHYPDYPAIAIAIELKFSLFTNYEKLSQDIYNHLQLEHTIYIVPMAGDYKKLAKRIRKQGEQIL